MTLILKASYVYDAMKKIHEKSCKSPSFFCIFACGLQSSSPIPYSVFWGTTAIRSIPDAKPILVKDIMKRLAQKFPTFTIRKGTDMELGHRLSAMGYTYHKLTQVAAYRIIEI